MLAFYQQSASRRTRGVVRATALLALLAAPGAAQAAALQVDQPCYADPGTTGRRDAVRIRASGMTPGAPYQLTLDGQPVPGGTGLVAADGSVATTLGAPRLATTDDAARDHRYVVALQEGATEVRAAFEVTTLVAQFTPPSGDPRTLRVRFSGSGFALAGAVHPTVYLHYVAPGGKLKRTVSLGRTRGACGTLRPTKLRRLFASLPVAGTWGLQFDTSRRYRRGTSKSTFLFYAVTVTVRR